MEEAASITLCQHETGLVSKPDTFHPAQVLLFLTSLTLAGCIPRLPKNKAWALRPSTYPPSLKPQALFGSLLKTNSRGG